VVSVSLDPSYHIKKGVSILTRRGYCSRSPRCYTLTMSYPCHPRLDPDFLTFGLIIVIVGFVVIMVGVALGCGRCRSSDCRSEGFARNGAKTQGTMRLSMNRGYLPAQLLPGVLITAQYTESHAISNLRPFSCRFFTSGMQGAERKRGRFHEGGKGLFFQLPRTAAALKARSVT